MVFYDRMASTREGRYRSRFDPDILERIPETREAFRRFFESVVGTGKPAIVLDLGCGTGLYHPVLAPLVGKLVGIDNSLAMLERARHVRETLGLDTELLHGNADDLPFPDGTFDMVIAYDVLHHVRDLPSVVDGIRRVLRPGGRFVGAESTILCPWGLAYNVLHREEWGTLRIRPAYLRRAFARFARFRLRPDNTRFFPHAPVLERAFKLVERHILCGPLKWMATRYMIEAQVGDEVCL